MGRTATFTSDLKDRWGRAWTSWEGAARLVAQLGRHLSRVQDDSRVRLEAETAQGQLELRADVVDDTGRTESFRRLRVRVSGPDGFSRDVALDPTGPGAYGAAVPLSQPGAYIAVARDELSSQALATTGAVLTSGEELRPTGTDYALLNRIAELTGGKRRDTLAGIFGDRAGRRFAYQDVSTRLLIVAAFALLLMVAARRFAMPEVVGAYARQALGWRPWSGRATARAQSTVGAHATDTLASLIKSKEQKQRERVSPEQDQALAEQAAVRPAQPGAMPSGPGAHRAPSGPPAAPAAAELAPSTPSWGNPPEASAGFAPSSGPASLRRPRRAARAPAEEASSGATSSRPLTAAEILLARRRGKR